MSVTVRQLNADSTFLFIFSHKAQPSPYDLTSFGGAFTILVDPWLTGNSIVNAKWFAVTERKLPSAVNHLSELEDPNVVLISQNKPDHCHKQTLLQLDPTSKTIIAAEPGAARVIKSWHYFDTNRVHALQKYDRTKRGGRILRITIPPLSADGLAGEVNIAFLPARNYVTGLHNAFGITYIPPTGTSETAASSQSDVTTSGNSMIIDRLGYGSPKTPSFRSSDHGSIFSTAWSTRQSIQPAESQSLYDKPKFQNLPLTGHLQFSTWSHHNHNPMISSTCSTPSLPSLSNSSSVVSPKIYTPSIPLPATSTLNLTNMVEPSQRTLQAASSRRKTVSVLYSPHGLPLRDIETYIRNHLVPLPGALPLTCLLHSFDYASNPWWLGGNIMMGVEGGIDIARALMAQCWISAHDEVKNDQGIAVKFLKSDRASADTVRRKIQQDSASWPCNVCNLEVGTQITLNSIDTSLSGRRKLSGLGIPSLETSKTELDLSS